MIEIVIMVMVLGILTAGAAPSFHRFIAAQAVESAAKRIQADLQLARSHARLKSTTQVVQFSPSAPVYELVSMADPNHPRQSYQVDLSSFPYGVQLSLGLGTGDRITFDAHGHANVDSFIEVWNGPHRRTVRIDAAMGKVTRE